MDARLRIFKIKALTAFMLVLCFATPFMFSAVSAYIMATHTHICQDEEHKDDCVGTEECCRICQSLVRMKNRTSNYSAMYGLSATPVPTLLLLVVNFEFQRISYISLITLKVRLNN